MERPCFEVGFRSVRSGLKIHVWTSSAYSLYSSDTEWEITKRVSIEREKKRDKAGPLRRQPNIWRSGSLGKASEIQGATAFECSVLAARGQKGSTMSDATDSSKQVGTEKGSLQLATWRWWVTFTRTDLLMSDPKPYWSECQRYMEYRSGGSKYKLLQGGLV